MHCLRTSVIVKWTAVHFFFLKTRTDDSRQNVKVSLENCKVSRFVIVLFLSVCREKTPRFVAGCFPLDELRRSSDRMSTSDIELECAKLAERLSACSFPHTPPSTPERSVASGSLSRFVSYIDDTFSSDDDEVDVCDHPGDRPAKCGGGGAASRRQFSSDSGISSSSATPTDPNKATPAGRRSSSSSSFNRSAGWTSSFRKLIRRVATKKQPANES